MFVHFPFYNTKHSPPKSYKTYRYVFSIFVGFQNANELHVFGNLVVWLRKSYGNILKEFVGIVVSVAGYRATEWGRGEYCLRVSKSLGAFSLAQQ